MITGTNLKITNSPSVIKNTLVHQISRVLFGKTDICFHLSTGISKKLCAITNLTPFINFKQTMYGFRN